MPALTVRGSYYSIYENNKCIKYIGKSKEKGEAFLDILKNFPELLVDRNDQQALAEYKKVKRKLVLSEFQESQINLKLGDFRDLVKELPDNSMDLVLTDPPYPKEYLPLWSDLAKESARVLKPGAFLIAYSGQGHLTEVLKMLSEHLEYYWLGTLYHKGPTAQRFEVNMWNRAKPILFYYKKPKNKQQQWLEDVLESSESDKNYHDWGQSVAPLIKLVECFSLPNQVILDPFVGGGSTIEACRVTKRNVIAFEIDRRTFDSIRERFNL
jgi:DNA modification methylase